MNPIRFSLHVACDNAAFETNMASELARILRDVAQRLEYGDDFSPGVNVRDSNGNRVGVAQIKAM